MSAPILVAGDLTRDPRTQEIYLALRKVEERGRAMAAFCDRVRERGGRAEVEEDEDLVALRAEWLMLRARLTIALARVRP